MAKDLALTVYGKYNTVEKWRQIFSVVYTFLVSGG
jgi:hypothetical protein